MDTKNVFIDITGTDLTKCKIVLAILASQFSIYGQGDDQFHIEPVEVVYEDQEVGTLVTPNFELTEFEVESQYICKLLGI